MAKLNLFNQGEYGANDVGHDANDIVRIYKNPKDQAEALALETKLNRKKYENFNPYPTSTPIDPKNPGGSPDVVGADRIYALYQHALDNNLDFARVLYNDRQRYPERTPNTLEFENERFDLFNGNSGGDHWRRATPEDLENYKKYGDKYGEIKDGWKHISRGSNYGDDILRLLATENFK